MFAAARALLEKEKAEGREIAEEVAANVSLGYAKYHMSRLTNAAELLGDSGAAAEPESSNGWIPEHLRSGNAHEAEHDAVTHIAPVVIAGMVTLPLRIPKAFR